MILISYAQEDYVTIRLSFYDCFLIEIKKQTKKCFTSFHNWIRFKFRGVQFSSNRMIASQHYTHVQL